MTGSRDVPSSRLGRLARMAAMGARLGANAVTGRDPTDAVKAAADALGTLRGVAAKLGQMTAYVDGVVPEEHRDSYEQWMKGLLSATPKSSPEAIKRVIETDFGKPIDKLFTEFDDNPIASASIGQVHRAVTLDGREVAVKVQHPGVAEAVESDLNNAGVVEGAMSMVTAWRKLESKRVLQEVRDKFREELDYRREAEQQNWFRTFHAGSPQIHVPEVIADHSSKRVLTSSFIRGLSFDEARKAPESLRQKWCETLWLFVYKATIVGGYFNADPHPGNYFFHDDGSVSFIDFGCIQENPPKRQALARRLHLAACAKDLSTFENTAKIILETKGGSYEKRALRYCRFAFSPQFDSPFRITRDYAAAVVAEVRSMAIDGTRGKEEDMVPLPPGVFFMNRLQFGFFSVLARLDAEVDYASLERSFLQDAHHLEAALK